MTNRLILVTITLILGLAPFTVFGQDGVIRLINPSFEDYPRAETVPHGWKNCGFPDETPPDTHPSGAFDVIKYPSDGNTYLGMVVRDNDTWERVSQKLTTPIQGGTCYSFSLNLSRSELYVSASKVTNTRSNYVQPIKLVIWGVDGYCEKKERLAESPLIANTTWQPFAFKFEPKQTHTHIMLEAFYKTPVLFPYNGNILIDKASDIVPMPCDQKEAPVLAKMPEVEFTTPQDAPVITRNKQFSVKAAIKNIDEKLAITFKVNGRINNNFTFDGRTGKVSAKATNLRKGNNRVVMQATNKAGTTEDSAIIIYEPEEIVAYQEPPTQPQVYETPITPKIVSPSKEEKKLKDFAGYRVYEGQTIPFNAISFAVNDTTLNKVAYTHLDKLYKFLREYEEVIIEIGGHTSGLCKEVTCNYLSTVRARQVATYLQDKGIPQKQLIYKGYGKSKPIASNRTTIGREKNRRIEIKILSTDG